MEFVTHSPEQTRQLGARLAKALKPGAVVAFTGDLGAGKTAFVCGMAQGRVCAVEWSENVAEAMETGTIRVSIRREGDENSRVIGIEGVEL